MLRCGLAVESSLPLNRRMQIQNLRSPYDRVNGLMYFGRMLDKIRLHSQGKLPADYIANLGVGFDERALSFLHLTYADLGKRTLQGGSDEEVLGWCFEQGRRPSPEEIEVWNEFMRKRGWNDEASERLNQRKQEGGFSGRDDIQTFFDFIDLDEGRK
jgi:hypothetical protein